MKSFLQYVFTEYHQHALKDIYRTSDTRQKWNLKQKFHGIKDIPRIWVISLFWKKQNLNISIRNTENFHGIKDIHSFELQVIVLDNRE